MRILLALDDSPHSRRALERVREMKWPAGTTISVVSAVRLAPVLAYAEFPSPGTLPVEPMFEDRVHVHEALVRHAEETLRSCGLQVQGRVLHGDAREAIVEAARRDRADLIVMGSHGRTGLARLLMGSVAAHVVAHAPCDVLVVRLQQTIN